MQRNVLVAAVLAMATGAAGTAMAQEALYGPQPPKGSAYVRFVNTIDAPVDLRPDFLPAAHLGVNDADRVGAYFVVERVAGRTLRVDLTVGTPAGHVETGHAELQATPNGFLTIVAQRAADGTLTALPIADLSQFNQNRARLSFYNATPGCGGGSLALEPGGQAVFKDVAPGASRARAVNPVNAQLKAACTDEAAPPVTLAGVEAGSMFSVWLMQAGGQPTAFVTQDIATPYQR